jgi:zinc D-Ala-D-Ala dipeptidase
MKAASAGLLLSMCMCLPASAEPPDGFVDIERITKNIRVTMPYATPDNFTGRVVPGYAAPRCWLREPVAKALASVVADFARAGYILEIYDCYRPRRAVEAFVAWAKDDADGAAKARYYPDLPKSALLGAYIGEKSLHSTGTAVDVGLWQNGKRLDFGTPFDFFGPQSNTKNARTSRIRANRALLVKGMAKHGFKNYPGEWWHFSYPMPGAEAIDVPIE